MHKVITKSSTTRTINSSRWKPLLFTRLLNQKRVFPNTYGFRLQDIKQPLSIVRLFENEQSRFLNTYGFTQIQHMFNHFIIPRFLWKTILRQTQGLTNARSFAPLSNYISGIHWAFKAKIKLKRCFCDEVWLIGTLPPDRKAFHPWGI